MTWSLPLDLTLHRLVQLKLNSDVNWTIKLSQKIRVSAKQNAIRWCQQCNKPGTKGRTQCDLLKGYEQKTNYVKNTTSVSSCDLEQVSKICKPKISITEIMPALHFSCFIKIDVSKTRMKWHKFLVSDIMTLSKQMKSDQLWLSWTEW